MVKIMPSTELQDQKVRVPNRLCLKSIRTHSYHKLPQQLLHLSVLKLDGSSFDIYIQRNARIAELKQAVEEVFSLSPKDGEEKNSWSHVWGHFCLCYEGKKLINDKVYIKNIGINDGDQLKFIRNMSINYRPVRQRSKNISGAFRHLSMFLSRAKPREKGEQIGKTGNRIVEDQNNFQLFHCEDEEEVLVPKFKLAHFSNGWLSYSKLRRSTRKVSFGRSHRSRFSLH